MEVREGKEQIIIKILLRPVLLHARHVLTERELNHHLSGSAKPSHQAVRRPKLN